MTVWILQAIGAATARWGMHETANTSCQVYSSSHLGTINLGERQQQVFHRWIVHKRLGGTFPVAPPDRLDEVGALKPLNPTSRSCSSLTNMMVQFSLLSRCEWGPQTLHHFLKRPIPVPFTERNVEFTHRDTLTVQIRCHCLTSEEHRTDNVWIC